MSAGQMEGDDARRMVLGRIRRALGSERAEGAAASSEREYRLRDEAPHERLVEDFVERVREYRATVECVAVGALAGAVADTCRTLDIKALLIPTDLPREWAEAAARDGVQLQPDTNLSNEELDACDAVLTGCALGIAQTGTIVLDAGPAQGRRAITLVPDRHLCVVRERQIVGLVPEAIAALADAVRDEGQPLTFISGPSATSDIELSRVEGVHGPRTLVVFVVAEGED